MKKFAVFDIDGTLIRWQLYHAIVNRLAKKNLLKPGAREQLQSALMHWKNRESEAAFHEYENALIAIYESSLSFIQPTLFDETIDEIVKEYKKQTYLYTRNLVKQLKRQGYFLIALSGSHEEIVEHIAKTYGFDTSVGTRYERNEEGFTGKKYIASLHKKTELERLIKLHDLSLKDSYAIGDSKTDAVMLEMVDNPIAFNPNQELYIIAKQEGWTIIVERKNVIYQLEKHGEQYILA